MARTAGVSVHHVRQVWAAADLKPRRLKTFKISRDPRFAEKVQDVVGLYLNPPENAMVLSVDGMTTELKKRYSRQIAALEKAIDCYRHPEAGRGGERKPRRVAYVCGRDRKIYVAPGGGPTVLDRGPRVLVHSSCRPNSGRLDLEWKSCSAYRRSNRR